MSTLPNLTGEDRLVSAADAGSDGASLLPRGGSSPVEKPTVIRIADKDLTPEAARERGRRRRGYEAASRKVRELGREQLHAIAAEIQEVPTDMPASEDVKQAYEAAFEHMRRERWDQAREKLFELGVAALGWAARIDVAEIREEQETRRQTPAAKPKPPKGAARVCEQCGAEFKLAGPGRPPKKCPECRR